MGCRTFFDGLSCLYVGVFHTVVDYLAYCGGLSLHTVMDFLAYCSSLSCLFGGALHFCGGLSLLCWIIMQTLVGYLTFVVDDYY